MNPVLAFALIATAGILITRLPRLPTPHALGFALVLAAGTPLVLLGLLLGPGIDLLERPVLRALAPVTALAVGWIGAVFGARFKQRVVRRIPRGIWLLALIQACAVFLVVSLTAWVLGRFIPALGAAWVPRLPAVLTLGAVAVVSGPNTVALVVRASGVRRGVARAFAVAAALDTAFGALAFTLALALYHPRQPVGGVALSWVSWLALAIGSGALVGVFFLGLSRPRPEPEDLALSLLGAMLLGAGVGYAADLSPFVVCALGAALIVNVSPRKRAVEKLLHDWKHPIHVVFLIIAGALLTLPTGWILVAVLVLGALRIATRWATVRYGREYLKMPDLPPHAGLAGVAQGGVAVALGINFFIMYGGPGGPGGAVITTIVLGVALTQLAAPTLMGLALRAPPLTQAPVPVELSPELRSD